MTKYIELKNFRNHLNYKKEITKNILIIEGDNGVGKTSILEAIYFAATTKSHRNSNDSDLIYNGKEFAVIKIKTSNDQFEIILSKQGKRTFINQVEKKRISDYIGNYNVVLFAPEDLLLVKGSPMERRYFLDLELMQLSKDYLKALTTYKKILKQRNALLKRISLKDDYTFLNILADQLYQEGIKIIDYRSEFIKSLNEKAQKYLSSYQDFNVEIEYLPNVTKEQFLKHLHTKQKQDIFNQTTMAGIHKDDFIFKLNGHPAKQFASQGQIRLMAIILKLSLLDLIKEKMNNEVLLLLDDVFSELDTQKQQLFIDKLSHEHQVIITSAVHLDLKNKNIESITL